MRSWEEFIADDPELGEFGRQLFEEVGIAYLATVRQDGTPRVHPVSPKIVEGHLFVGIIATSPKRQDLLHDGRYMLHSLPGPESAEFFIKGRAKQVCHPEIRARVAATDDVGILVVDDDDLFELEIEQACSTIYEIQEQEGQTCIKPIRKHWSMSHLLLKA